MPFEITMLFNSRIVPGVYKFDIVVTSQPGIGAVVGCAIVSSESYLLDLPNFLVQDREKIESDCLSLYANIRKVIGD